MPAGMSFNIVMYWLKIMSVRMMFIKMMRFVKIMPIIMLYHSVFAMIIWTISIVITCSVKSRTAIVIWRIIIRMTNS